MSRPPNPGRPLRCPNCGALLILPGAAHKCVAVPPRAPVMVELALELGPGEAKDP